MTTPVDTRRPGDLLRASAVSRSFAGVRALNDVTITVRPGEVLGIAGVDGNGQWELFQVLAGLRAPTAGTIRLGAQTVQRLAPDALIAAGMGAIPPDRQRYGLVLAMSVADNALLNSALLARLASGPFLPLDASRAFARDLANGPAFAHSMTKNQLNMEWTMSLETALEAEAQAQAICMQTKDFERAYIAFAAKQKPAFEGN